MSTIVGWLGVASGIAVALALVRLAALMLPRGGVVRARNAFLLKRGAGIRFDWTPMNVPHDFPVAKRVAPAVIVRAMRDAGIDRIEGDRTRAFAIVGCLLRNANTGGGIRADLATTFRGIQAGRGYCADFVRVYMVAAACVNLFCRRWAFSFDGFGGHGHTFVEVYDGAHARWTFIDVFNNVYAVKRGEQRPLDALELRAQLIRDPGAVQFVQASSGRLGYPHHEKLVDYYERGGREWCIWWGNDESDREYDVLARILRRFSGRLAYRLITGMLTAPHLIALEDGNDEAALARVATLRREIVRAGTVALVGALLVVFSISVAQAAKLAVLGLSPVPEPRITH